MSQKLHPVALVLTSHTDREAYEKTLRDLKQTYFNAGYGVLPDPNYFVTDADKAEKAAITAVFPHTKTLMCWFHVKKNIKEKFKGDLQLQTGKYQCFCC